MELAVFKQRVGQRLGAVPVSGSLSAEDGALVAQAYGLLVQELTTAGLAYWSAEDSVPDEFADIMVGMTAANLVDDFTIPEPRRSQMIVQSKYGLPQASVDERRLRALTAIPIEEPPSAAEYY